ncbi:hypothetical protein JMUB7517_27860 [Staphylococcus aureus]
MQRSLVGSEMCIRDRPFLHPFATKLKPKPLRISWKSGCLLYTSDAADEGLGVDLGGRRIIKK